jgi:hypothetical protein
VLRLLRANLLSESAAVRLHHPIDFEKAYRTFQRYRSEQARRRVTDAVMDQLDGQANEKLIIRLDRIVHLLSGLFLQARRGLALPSVNFTSAMGKWSFAFNILMRFAAQFVVLTGVTALLTLAGAVLTGQAGQLTLAVFVGTVLGNPLYVIAVLVLIFVSGRTVLFRLDDKDD